MEPVGYGYNSMKIPLVILPLVTLTIVTQPGDFPYECWVCLDSWVRLGDGGRLVSNLRMVHKGFAWSYMFHFSFRNDYKTQRTHDTA